MKPLLVGGASRNCLVGENVLHAKGPMFLLHVRQKWVAGYNQETKAQLESSFMFGLLN